MDKPDTKKPLEVQIIKNLSFLELGRNRVCCDTLVITPPMEERDKTLGNKTIGRIRGFREDSKDEIFTRFYHPNWDVIFKVTDGGLLGTLMVGGDTYFAKPKGQAASELIVHETKKFNKGYEELWEYMESSGLKK